MEGNFTEVFITQNEQGCGCGFFGDFVYDNFQKTPKSKFTFDLIYQSRNLQNQGCINLQWGKKNSELPFLFSRSFFKQSLCNLYWYLGIHFTTLCNVNI